MAKKKNKTTPAAAASPTSSAAAVATAAPAADAIDRAYAAGNYAAVRRLAASTPSARCDWPPSWAHPTSRPSRAGIWRLGNRAWKRARFFMKS